MIINKLLIPNDYFFAAGAFFFFIISIFERGYLSIIKCNYCIELY